MLPSATIITAIAIIASLYRRQCWLGIQISRELLRIRKEIRACQKTYNQPRPGRGVPAIGFKRSYRTDRKTNRYARLRADETWFRAIVHLSEDDFDALHEIVASEIDSPLDPYNVLTSTDRLFIRRRRKKLTSKDLLFLYLEVLGGGSCGSDAIVNMSNKYGVCNGSIWNYIYHTGWACYRALRHSEPITWPNTAERASMKGLIKGFPDAVMFVDGTRQPIYKSIYEDIQNDQYFGKDRRHCYAVLIYVDIYGFIRRVEVSYSGRLHDKSMFQISDVYLNRTEYFSEGEQMICDAGFVGAGDTNWIIVPFKNGTGLFFEMRRSGIRTLGNEFVTKCLLDISRIVTGHS